LTRREHFWFSLCLSCAGSSGLCPEYEAPGAPDVATCQVATIGVAGAAEMGVAGVAAAPDAAAALLTIDKQITEAGIAAAADISVVARSFLSSVLSSSAHARSWLIDLAACQQVAPLDRENVTSYFASCGSPGVAGAVILPLIRFGASVMPKLVQVPVLRARHTQSKFLR